MCKPLRTSPTNQRGSVTPTLIAGLVQAALCPVHVRAGACCGGTQPFGCKSF